MIHITRLLLGTTGALIAIALAGCQQRAAKEEAPATAAPAGLTKLPISINATMVGLVDHSSDFIFAVGNGDLPKNDHDWDMVKDHAYEMILAGQIIQIPGTGDGDAAWVANSDWKTWSQDLTEIGQMALGLANAKSTDAKSWQKIGDDLVQNCLACHQKYKPDIPSQGILHGGTKGASEGKSVFD